jgi:hypothetical protein
MESSVTRVIDLRQYRHGSLPEGLRQMLIDVHADSYADAMDLEFNQKFPWFVDHWSAMPGFTCVVCVRRRRANRLRVRRTAATRPRMVAFHRL